MVVWLWCLLWVEVVLSLSTSTVEADLSVDFDFAPREVWDVEWVQSSAPFAPVRSLTFNVGTGRRLASRASPREWQWGFEFRDPVRTSRLVGLPAVLGDTGEGSRYTLRSAEGMDATLQEQMFTEVYCRGAKHRRWFFGDAETQRGLGPANLRCVEACFSVAGVETQYNASRAELAASPSLRDCRVPLTHLVRAPLVKTALGDGARASLELPRFLWRHAGVAQRSDLAAALLNLRIEFCPPQTEETETRQFVIRPGSASPEIASTEPPSPTPAPVVPPRYPARRPPWKPDGAFDFFPEDSLQAPIVWAAPAMHYASLAASSFSGASVTGYFQEEASLLGMRGVQGEAVVDVVHTLQRLFEADRLELALQSNCAITDISPEIVLRKVVAWTHPIDAGCAQTASCTECVSHGCVWCKQRSTAAHYLDQEWAQVAGIHTLGRCGTPLDACALLQGTPTQSVQMC
eukprot:Gregarina_sp_Pseudo_9__911@NODE_1585_length_1478_cov_14_275886_g1470_i0_p1_GENE_NODE_1585_length_1478_cov_14_275886_g1470_i0NODE_1585_length_1478_cov_14_275886_g1470_i0_p1_ORF_typecomplete_len461_score138_03PSI_integrin/PF17205_3/0_032PSI/PF01437_25/0_11_NODE_1585_length_1478_cov_14_275886_g1470_i0521434